MRPAALLLIILFIAACTTGESRFTFQNQENDVPRFSADSAYAHLQKQVAFGPRVPNSDAHHKTLQYLSNQLQQYAGKNGVFVQKFNAEGYGEELHLANIIASFNLTAKKRIMLAAHWDTRPRADEDSVRKEQPVSGADDGASGVAVLLEIARIMGEKEPQIGVDIVLFDGEDYGESGDLDKYFLGSRYWSENPPVAGYNPYFAILLDMVGAKNARFPKEEYSVMFAKELVQNIWKVAGELGYELYFPDEQGALVSDDHVIVNRITGIPMVNIINHGRNSRGVAEFAGHWHTHADSLNIISLETLQAAGDVLTEIIYNRISR